MSRILILDDNTINQIAAGEVVERPASIIKELVENSIDALCTSITIEIEDGGLRYIRVTDNGIGMSHGDALKSLERHATSKIVSSNDLNNIVTLGFRGEALASIAAVTKMEIITREKDSISGSQIINHGGDLVSNKEIGCPEGTTIIVRDLFFNVPARLKFVKSFRAETAHISRLVEKLILGNPKISFRYINNGRIVYYSPGDGQLKNSIFSVYGRDIIDHILPVHPIGDSRSISLSGFLGKPAIARKNRIGQSFFVNHRFIKSGLIEASIESAYKTYLTANLFPWVILNINIAPNKIDVNIHPAKTEIRFKDEKAVSEFIRQQIGSVLAGTPYIPALGKDSFKPHIGKNDKDQCDDMEEGYQVEAFSSISSEESITDDVTGQSADPKKEVGKAESPSKIFLEEEPTKAYIASPIEDPENGINRAKETEFELRDSYQKENATSHYKVIGRIFTTYIIVERDSECFLIDQHAAHERILFEKYKNMFSNQAIITQRLLPPIIVEVTHGEQLILNESMNLFQSLGFEIDSFGGRTYAIRGTPVVLGVSNPKAFFHGLLDDVDSFTQGSNYELMIEDIIRMSCKKAVKAGDILTNAEVYALLDALMEDRIPLTCPHGRPIMISLTKTELEKMFKRIQ
ncbi:MAG: DNA mismatch repair endonuclease MutL [Clostridiales bacterium]|nr:DNA mismatch repair endonuclease MutL [Clostridiales bacterium]